MKKGARKRYGTGGLTPEGRAFNLKVKKMADERGFTYDELGKEYPKVMAQAAVEALTDANFHPEARKLVSLLEKKPEWAKDPMLDENRPKFGTAGYDEYHKKSVYSSEYYDADKETRDFARAVSEASGYDGYDIANAFQFVIMIQSGNRKLADQIKEAMEDEPEQKMAKGGEVKMSYDDFVETLQEYEIEGGFGKTLEKGYAMYYLPNGHPYLNTKFGHRNKKKAYQEYLKMSKMSEGGKVKREDDFTYTYMMLGRLQSDNEYFLGFGNRNPKHLWAGNVDDQIAEMKKLWNQLPNDKKPEWLSMQDILDYEKKMKTDTMKKGGKVSRKRYASGGTVAPTQKEINKFFNYCKSFYGTGDSVYGAEFFPPKGASDVEIKRAIEEYLKSPEKWGGGDSVDRENVRDILMQKKSGKKMASGGMMDEGGEISKELKWFDRLKTYEREHLSKKYPFDNNFKSFEEWVEFVYEKEKKKKASGGYMAKGGQIEEFRIVPNKKGEGGTSHLVTTDFKMAFTVNGTKEEAGKAAQEFVIKNNETHPTATVTKIHPSGQPLKNKIVYYVTKDEIQKYAEGGMTGNTGIGKNFNVKNNVGKSKYVVSYHDGEKKHKDGSPFYDIEIFKNLKDLSAFKRKLKSQGYKETAHGGMFEHGGMLGNTGIAKNLLIELWFAVHGSKTAEYKSIAEKLDKEGVSHKIQNAVSADATSMRNKKRIDTFEVKERVDEILSKSGMMEKGGDLENWQAPKEIYSGKEFKITIPKMGRFEEKKLVAVYDKENFVFKLFDSDKKPVTKISGKEFENKLMNGEYVIDGYMDNGEREKNIRKILSGKKYPLSDKELKELSKQTGYSQGDIAYVHQKMNDDIQYSVNYMARGGKLNKAFVAVSEKDGYWYIISKPTSKENAQRVIDMGVPKGEVGKVVTVEEAKAHKKVIGGEYLSRKMANGGKVKRARFKDKVEAIADRLEGKKVPAKLKKDYGGRYSREEAEHAGRRIAGAQKAKYENSKSRRKRH